MPVQPTPAPVQPASGGELAPSSRTAPAGPEPSPAAGLGMLVTGPLLVLVAVPMSLVGNAAWRNNCGPNSSTGECADGSIGSFAMHTLAASSYGLGITFTGLGARKRAPYSVYSGRAPDGVPMIITGSTLLPLGLLGMGMARLFLWIGTTDCLEYSCVQNRQNLSTFTVAAGAAISAAGAGLLMYGAGVKRAQKHHELSLAPRFGRGFSGLGLTGRF
ncbi:hypothetical protein [Paraliomyxa miuraensis]|uniref:hypothetical protein n=1 Tax=Paraliomyxa miuraensis TaxID=376150 RepID=UPI0022564B19|nr:hypothetical protein [Paraliomyxa miuraensis]